MTSDEIIATPAPADRPSFTIRVGGTQISQEYQVRSIVVDRAFNRIASAEITIFDGDPATQTFDVSDAADFVPGNEIEILAGYHGLEEVIFSGIVVRHGLQASGARPSLLRVECRDAAFKLTVGRKTAYFYDETDADIIESICSAAGLRHDVDATQPPHPSMVQYYATDWDFVVTRAEANGLLVSTVDGEVVVTAPDASGEAALTVGYGGNILDFEAFVDARDQVAAVQSCAWSASDQELVEVPASSPNAVSPGNLSTDDLAAVADLEALELRHGGHLADEELQGWADGQRARSGFAKVRGRVRVQGVAEVRPGDAIELSGVGERFAGTAIVSGVHHELSARNWETDVAFGLSPQMFGTTTPDVVDAAANGLLPGVEGLHVGLVTSLEDPDSESRIQVRLPMIDATGEGVWARVATLDAGSERGSFFRPEVDDEVVVGFLGGDPRNPVVVGMVHSAAKPAPLEANDDNHLKGFVTRSGIKLLFDDENGVATLETPNGNTLVVSDDVGSVSIVDESGNTLVLDSAGIMLESPGDLVLKASGDVKIEGANISAAASAQLTAEGSAGAELSSGASTVVQGSVVQIN